MSKTQEQPAQGSETDKRPEWMREHGLTRADLEEEANSEAPDAWVFEAALQSLDEEADS